LAKLAAWALSLMYMIPKLAAWALRLEAGAIDEVTIAIDCEDREESSRRRSPQGTCWAEPCSFFLKIYRNIWKNVYKIIGPLLIWAPGRRTRLHRPRSGPVNNHIEASKLFTQDTKIFNRAKNLYVNIEYPNAHAFFFWNF
jgi:hypothetical protein